MQSILELSGSLIGKEIHVESDLDKLSVVGVLQDIEYEITWGNLFQDRFGRASVTRVVVQINDSFLHLNTSAGFEVLDI